MKVLKPAVYDIESPALSTTCEVIIGPDGLPVTKVVISFHVELELALVAIVLAVTRSEAEVEETEVVPLTLTAVTLLSALRSPPFE